MKKRIVILGGGISGLSLAWELKKKLLPSVKVTVLEKNERPGGWIHTIKKEGFLFELGTRSLRTTGNKELLLLVKELELLPQILTPSGNARRRYLWHKEKLQIVPDNIFSLWTTPLGRILFFALLKEPFAPKGPDEESIRSFFYRRLGKTFTTVFIDPLITGIYAGSIDSLSFQACFPEFDIWEKKHGSLLAGFLKRKRTVKPTELKKQQIFTFKEGLSTLPKTLAKKLHPHIQWNQKVLRIKKDKDHYLIKSTRECLEADIIISTLPLHVNQEILQPFFQTTEIPFFLRTPSTSIALVCLGWRESILSIPGFGYLISGMENEEILGAVFDSNIFPEQNSHPQETRLTVMIGGAKQSENVQLSEDALITIAIKAIYHHLKIDKPPSIAYVYKAHKAIPQYTLGHEKRIQHFLEKMKTLAPFLYFTGNFLHGVSVGDCVKQANHLAKSINQSCPDIFF
jgi:oxygen-dependent protoporphyrinogen oxidase